MSEEAVAVPRPISSTSDLTPDGILGYAKGIAAAATLAVEALAEVLPEQWRGWARVAIALLGLVGVVLTPNRFGRLHVVAAPPPPA